MTEFQEIQTHENGSLEAPKTFNKELHQYEAETKILISLPEDLYDTYYPLLQKRLSAYNNIVIAKAPGTVTKKFDYNLSFHNFDFLKIRKNASSKKTSDEFFFEVQGAPNLDTLQTVKCDNQILTPIEKKFATLKNSIFVQERDKAFAKLAYFYAIHRYKSQILKEREKQIATLQKKITKVEKPYYYSLSYILVDAVEKLTGVGEAVENLMKSLVRILIVDDLQDYTVNGLIPHGFNRKYLSTMSSYELQSQYNAFLAENINDYPLEHLTIKDFLIKSAEMEPYDIIIINFWRFKDERVPVWIRIKKKPIVSKKEQRQLETAPQVLTEEINRLNKKHNELKQQLEEAEQELHEYEINQDIPEERYQASLKKRKRLVKRIQKNTEQLKKKQTPRSQKTHYLFYSRGLIQTLRENQTLKERIEEKISEWQGWGDLLKGYLNSNDDMNTSQLKKMLNLSQANLKTRLSTEKLKSQIAALEIRMTQHAQKNNLWEDKTGYQSFLENYAMDKIELTVSGCCISRAISFYNSQ